MATIDPLTGLPQVDPIAPTTGLINSAPTTQAASSFMPTAPAAPKAWSVTPDQTVQGQVKNIIADNSPLMQQAETRSLQKMNERGGINSSMAIGAGQSALYDAAMPMAASDAATYARSGEVNNNTTNQFSAAANAQGFDLAKMDKGQGFDMAKMDKQFTNNAAELTQKFGYDTALTKMQADSARETSNIAAQYRNLTQASSSAASLMNNAASNIQGILLNETLDGPAKQVAIDTHNANLNKSLQLIGAFAGDVDLSSMLDGLLGGGETASNFDSASYLANNPDVAADPYYRDHPEEHYNSYGKSEGRQLGQEFTDYGRTPAPRQF